MQRMSIALTVLVVCWTMGVNTVAAERIRILDRCDPATFNAPGPVLCNPDFDGGAAIPGQKSASNMLGQWNFGMMPLSRPVKARVVGGSVPYG